MDFSFLQTNQLETTSSTYNHTSQSFGAEDPDRWVVVVAWGRANANNRPITGVTIGGETAIQLAQAFANDSGNCMTVGIYAALLPTGASGTVSVTFSGSQLRCAIAVYRTIRLNPIPYDTDVSAGTGNPSATLDIPPGGIALAAAGNGSASGGTDTWTGITEDFGITIPAATNRFTGGHDEFPSGATAHAISCAFSVSSTYRIAAVSLREVAIPQDPIPGAAAFF